MLPTTTGIGLKSSHYEPILAGNHPLQWFELHPENYMGGGGLPHKYLNMVCENYQISMHGVGMSLGSADGIDMLHLQRLKQLVDRYQPAQVSEHISWSHGHEIFHNDLLPLPYNQESIDVLSNNIDLVQSTLGRQILIENPSTYLGLATDQMSEPEFIAEVQKRSGCGLLLDVNNVYVSAKNNGFDPYKYIDQYPTNEVGEIHLAGHKVEKLDGTAELLIDDHGSSVNDAVWQLHGYTLNKLDRPVAVLVEWDTDVPSFSSMLNEAEKATLVAESVAQSHGAQGSMTND